MGVSIEWTSGLIRLGENHNVFGDPYECTVSVLRHQELAILFGMSGRLRPTDRRAITGLLKSNGITKVLFFRGNEKTPKVLNL